MTLTRAHLSAGDVRLVMPVNPYSAQWAYQNNTASTDTIGGRVVQLLSVQVTDISVTSVAGGRRELQKVADGIKAIMTYHIRTSLPARFVVPSRAWNMSVFVKAMPQIGWDVAATTYPYQLTMAIVDDLNGVKTRQVSRAALSQLADGIGYNPAVHGGNTGAFNELVDTVLKMAPEVTTGSGSGGGGGAGTAGQWQGNSLWQPDVSNAPWNGKTIKDQIYNAFRAVFGPDVATKMACIAGRETGGTYNPRSINHYPSDTGIHYVYGLFQISDIHKGNSWWPSSVRPSDGGLMWDPEYNTRCAMMLYKQSGFGPWVSTSGQCGV